MTVTSPHGALHPRSSPFSLTHPSRSPSHDACWSPDSRRIAYCARLLNPDLSCAGETSIFVTDPDGKNTVTVATEKHEPNVIALQLTDWR
jgi:hypothetical protein